MKNQNKLKNTLTIAFSLFTLFSMNRCSTEATRPSVEPANLSAASAWSGDNFNRLNEMIQTYGNKNSDSKPVAIFDWDNTMAKNDTGDMTLFWMLKNNKIIHQDWQTSSTLLSSSAKQALETACPEPTSPRKQLITDGSTPASIACADEIISIYTTATTSQGSDAFVSDIQEEWIEPAYAWAVQLQAGYTPAEMREIALQAIQEALSREVGAKQTIGSTKQDAYLRVYEPMKELVKNLQSNGFDVWVVTASSQYLIEVFAERYVGVPADHVVGVKPLLNDGDENGASFKPCLASGPNNFASSLFQPGRLCNNVNNAKITTQFQGCGSQRDGNQSIITYRQGKRCFINEVIFGVSPTESMQTSSPITFTAGDSNTDLWMLRDAKALRLVINRNKEELMCHALENKDGKWLVNPMFIDPKPLKTSPYSCEKYGIADQQER